MRADSEPSRHALAVTLTEDIGQALKTLSTRERQVLLRSYGLMAAPRGTLDEIAYELGLPSENVRRIRSSAQAKISSGPYGVLLKDHYLDGTEPAEDTDYVRRCRRRVCGAPLEEKGSGRPRRYCSNACRQAAYRTRVYFRGKLRQEG